MRTVMKSGVASLAIHPSQETMQEAKEFTQVTFGDGHGNTYLNIFQLIQTGFLTLESETDLQRLDKICKEWAKKHVPALAKLREFNAGVTKYNDKVDKAHLAAQVNNPNAKKPKHKKLKKINPEKYQKIIAEFCEILDRAKIVDCERLFRSLGDLFCDRGACDLFTLALLYKIFSSKMRVEAILGNHDLGFLEGWANGFTSPKGGSINLEMKQNVSYANLFDLIQNGIVDKKEVDDLVRNFYLPNLRLISYSHDEHSMSLFLHAPITDPFIIISSLARYFNVEYKGSSKSDLGRSIDEINNKFLSIILGENGEQEFIKIQNFCKNRLVAPGLEKEGLNIKETQEHFEEEEERLKNQLKENEYEAYKQISNCFLENGGPDSLSDQQKLERLKKLAKTLNSRFKDTPYNKISIQTLKITLENIISKFPRSIQEKLRQEIANLNIDNGNVEAFEKSVAEIFNFLPVEYITLMFESNCSYAISDLEKTLACAEAIIKKLPKHSDLGQANQKEKRDAYKQSCEATKQLKFIEKRNALLKQLNKLEEKYLPFSALLWKRLKENPGAECPQTLEDGTQLYIVHGHDDPPPQEDANANRINLHSKLGFTVYKDENWEVESFNDFTGVIPLTNGSSRTVNEFKCYSNSDTFPTDHEITKHFREQARESIALEKLEVAGAECAEYIQPLLDRANYDIETYKMLGLPLNEAKVQEINTLSDLSKMALKISTVLPNPGLEAIQVAAIGAPLTVAQTPTQQEAAEGRLEHLGLEQVIQTQAQPQVQVENLAINPKPSVFDTKIAVFLNLLSPLQQNEPASKKLNNFNSALSANKENIAAHQDSMAPMILGLTLLTTLAPPIGLIVILILALNCKAKYDSYKFYESRGYFFNQNLPKAQDKPLTHKLSKAATAA